MAEAIELPFGVMGQMSPRSSPDPPREGQISGGGNGEYSRRPTTFQRRSLFSNYFGFSCLFSFRTFITTRLVITNVRNENELNLGLNCEK